METLIGSRGAHGWHSHSHQSPRVGPCCSCDLLSYIRILTHNYATLLIALSSATPVHHLTNRVIEATLMKRNARVCSSRKPCFSLPRDLLLLHILPQAEQREQQDPDVSTDLKCLLCSVVHDELKCDAHGGILLSSSWVWNRMCSRKHGRNWDILTELVINAGFCMYIEQSTT